MPGGGGGGRAGAGGGFLCTLLSTATGVRRLRTAGRAMRSRVRVIVLSRCVVQAHERKANVVVPHRRHYTVNTALTDRAYSPYTL